MSISYFVIEYFAKILYFYCFSFEVLLQSLEKIKDAEFVTSLCIGAQLPDITTTKKILNYAKDRLARTAKVQYFTIMQLFDLPSASFLGSVNHVPYT